MACWQLSRQSCRQPVPLIDCLESMLHSPFKLNNLSFRKSVSLDPICLDEQYSAMCIDRRVADILYSAMSGVSRALSGERRALGPAPGCNSASGPGWCGSCHDTYGLRHDGQVTGDSRADWAGYYAWSAGREPRPLLLAACLSGAKIWPGHVTCGNVWP